jgi:Zn ribbon nucleic-acid-binding protein
MTAPTDPFHTSSGKRMPVKIGTACEACRERDRLVAWEFNNPELAPEMVEDATQRHLELDYETHHALLAHKEAEIETLKNTLRKVVKAHRPRRFHRVDRLLSCEACAADNAALRASEEAKP